MRIFLITLSMVFISSFALGKGGTTNDSKHMPTVAGTPSGKMEATHDGARKEAERLLDTIDAEGLFEKSINQMIDVQLKQDPKLTPYRRILLGFIEKYMSYQSLKPDFIKMYTDAFTESDLREINRFYATPVGRKVLRKTPEFMKMGSEIGAKRLQQHIHELQQMIQAASENQQGTPSSQTSSSGRNSPVVNAAMQAKDLVPIGRVTIASRYDAVQVTRKTIGAELSTCIPQINLDSQYVKGEIQKFPSDMILKFGYPNSGKMFLLHQTTAVCLQESSEKFPIFAAEEFIDTINPQGVSPKVADGWYKHIALLIAAKGKAKIAYVLGNGDAYITEYWVESDQDFQLHYSCVFKRAGEWEKEKLDATFSNPSMTNISETKRSGLSIKRFPLAHRLLSDQGISTK